MQWALFSIEKDLVYQMLVVHHPLIASGVAVSTPIFYKESKLSTTNGLKKAIKLQNIACEAKRKGDIRTTACFIKMLPSHFY